MDLLRRDLALLLPVLAGGPAPAAEGAKLVSRTWLYEDLPVKESGPNRQRQVFDGESLNGFPIEMHETELAPGMAPHPPHKHPHHEMLILREGTVEVTIEGTTSRLTPGSIAYVGANEEHGWRNVGSTRARYYVLAFGRDRA
jgi:XRE family transcriptional regulator, regulator of sulfur utilization